MIDKNKTYRTRDGWPVEIYKTGCLGSRPVHGAYLTPSGESRVSQWTSEGKFVNDGFVCEFDLIEVKPQIIHELWGNVYPSGCVNAHPNRKDADRIANKDRIACVKITIDCEHGEGL